MEKDYNLQKPASTEKEKQNESILSYLASKNNQALQELNAEINRYQKEVEDLKAEIELLEKAADQPEPFMDFARSQSLKAVKTIDAMTEQTFAEIEKEGRIISEKHKQKIMELDANMQQGIQYAYKIMNDMLEKTSQPVKPVQAPVKEQIQTPVKEQILAPVKEQIIPAEEPGTAVHEYENKKEDSINEVEYQERPPVEEPGNMKIIEGFWEEPKAEEQPPIRTDAPEQNGVAVLKNMYVIGKVAGEDLFDKSGKLIIAKNEIITEEVINKAEKEGSLIELVLEMKLQEG